MDVQPLSLPEVLLITPRRHGDERGFLSETYSRRAFAEAGVLDDFVQDNHAASAARHTLRGLHFQVGPDAVAKLVRVARGAVLDVAVDLRPGSPRFGRWCATELSADNWRQIYVPKGFAHGYLTLTEGAEVLYKMSGYYAPAAERGVRWDDPTIGIDWGVDGERAVINARDRALPLLKDLEPCVFS